MVLKLGAVLSSIDWATEDRDESGPVPMGGANIRRLVGSDVRVAFISGNFNVVHAGHLRLFKFAAEMCDCLVVGLNPDATRRAKKAFEPSRWSTSWFH
jgi:cytidyltransferase-like protein